MHRGVQGWVGGREEGGGLRRKCSNERRENVTFDARMHPHTFLQTPPPHTHTHVTHTHTHIHAPKTMTPQHPTKS
jgi:hypothetical protein